VNDDMIFFKSLVDLSI